MSLSLLTGRDSKAVTVTEASSKEIERRKCVTFMAATHLDTHTHASARWCRQAHPHSHAKAALHPLCLCLRVFAERIGGSVRQRTHSPTESVHSHSFSLNSINTHTHTNDRQSDGRRERERATTHASHTNLPLIRLHGPSIHTHSFSATTAAAVVATEIAGQCDHKR